MIEARDESEARTEMLFFLRAWQAGKRGKDEILAATTLVTDATNVGTSAAPALTKIGTTPSGLSSSPS